eukprot:4777441-Prymnesium_polylepis.2
MRCGFVEVSIDGTPRCALGSYISHVSGRRRCMLLPALSNDRMREIVLPDSTVVPSITFCVNSVVTGREKFHRLDELRVPLVGGQHEEDPSQVHLVDLLRQQAKPLGEAAQTARTAEPAKRLRRGRYELVNVEQGDPL